MDIMENCRQLDKFAHFNAIYFLRTVDICHVNEELLGNLSLLCQIKLFSDHLEVICTVDQQWDSAHKRGSSVVLGNYPGIPL